MLIFVLNKNKTVIMIFCLDLENLDKSNYPQLLDKYPTLIIEGIDNCKKLGYSKIWISNVNDNLEIIAYEHPSIDSIEVVDIKKYLGSIKPDEFKTREERFKDLNTDDILDKISEKGLNNLTHEEKEYLDKFNS